MANPPTRRRAIRRVEARSISVIASSRSVPSALSVISALNGNRSGGARARVVCSVPGVALSDGERQVCEAIAERREELVELASRLIAFDTTAREVGDPPRDEAALQEYLGSRLGAAGARV